MVKNCIGAQRPTRTASDSRWIIFGVCLFLAVATWFIFGQTLRHEFVNFDDDLYVYENPASIAGLSLKGAAWAFTHSVTVNWHPLTVMSHMLDCQLYGLNAGGHHLTNVLLHAAVAVLLFLTLREMTGALWKSAFVAAVFAVHPLRVESVAWISERKDVLSGVFFMLTLWTYVCYVRKPYQFFRYLIVAIFFTLGLMSKPMLVTVPFVLLLLDYWPLNRFAPSPRQSQLVTPARLILEKVPLLLLSVAVCVVTLFVQKEAIQHVPFDLRIRNALVSYVAYVGQMIYPSKLAVYYPYPEQGVPISQVIVALIALVSISVCALARLQKQPYLLIGWLWYLGTLVPVIGLIQSGLRAHADRYTYLSQIGLYVALTWAAAEFGAVSRVRRLALGSGAAVILVIMVVCSRIQTRYWHDSELLWTHTLACTSDNNALAHSNLGNYLFQKGRLDEAVVHCQKTLKTWPRDAAANNCLGVDAYRKGQLNEAVHYFQQAVQSRPNFAPAENNLGKAFLQLNQVDDAFVHFQKALETDPNLPDAHYNLGVALVRKGQVQEGIVHYQRALELDPNLPDAHNNLGSGLLQKGEVIQAIAHFKRAIELKPDYAGAKNNLAWVLATSSEASVRNGTQAVELAQDANRLTGKKNLVVLRTLAAALAETGRFPEAMDAASQALQWAEARTNTPYVNALQAEIRLYQSGQPFREERAP